VGRDGLCGRRRDEDELQRGALALPEGATGAVPVVVLVHGGFWKPRYDRTLMEPLAGAVAAAGWAAWNVDYRPAGPGGGWPTTYTDVAAAVDHLAVLAEEHPIDLDRVAVVGHSAGGTLAVWTGGRGTLPEGAPGADPVVTPIGVVAQAGVLNLAAASLEGLGGNAVDMLMGAGPTGDDADDYLLASPIERVPIGTPALVVHGTDDDVVPVTQSTVYADRARHAGDDVAEEILDGIDHFAVIDPGSEAWTPVAAWLTERFA
jgi:acetyl esterase/lipase